MPFKNSVFINCPFDKEYKPLLKSMIFCLLYLDFSPNISATKSSANIRVNQIKGLIGSSKYCIHDLSRCRTSKTFDLPRFNMPFELGLDIGNICFGSIRHKSKRILILEKDRYFYQKIISDIGGQDISNHNNDPYELIIKVRNFFSDNSSKVLANSSSIWYAYNQFESDLCLSLLNLKYTKREIEQMTNTEYIKFCKSWLKSFKKK